jgi:hypothetical protein
LLIRGSLHLEQNKIELAKNDFNEVLQHDAENVQAKKYLERINNWKQ